MESTCGEIGEDNGEGVWKALACVKFDDADVVLLCKSLVSIWLNCCFDLAIRAICRISDKPGTQQLESEVHFDLSILFLTVSK